MAVDEISKEPPLVGLYRIPVCAHHFFSIAAIELEDKLFPKGKLMGRLLTGKQVRLGLFNVITFLGKNILISDSCQH